MSEFSPPNPPLSGPRVTLRQFRLTDAAAIASSCRDQDIPRFTMMLAGLSEEQARQWIESASAGWPEGVARFAITIPPADECVGQVGIQFDLAMRRAEAFYWLDRSVRGAGLAKVLLTGNHDRCWHGHGAKAERWITRYTDAGFDEIHQGDIETTLGSTPVMCSHFPYRGDSREHERYPDHRPIENGAVLLHVHVYERWKVRDRQVNVGVDVWGFRPITDEQILEAVEAESTD